MYDVQGFKWTLYLVLVKKLLHHNHAFAWFWTTVNCTFLVLVYSTEILRSLNATQR